MITKTSAAPLSSDILLQSFQRVLAQEYQVMYYIDLVEGQVSFIHGDETAKKFTGIFRASSPEAMFENFHKYYVDRVVKEEDRDKVRSVMNVANVNAVLENSPSVSVNYRAFRNGSTSDYTEMRIFKIREQDGRPTGIILAFRLSDKEVRSVLEENDTYREDIIKEMAGDESLYIVNPDTDEFRIVQAPPKYEEHYGSESRFSRLFELYVDRAVHPLDKERMRSQANIEAIANYLQTEKRFTSYYREILGDIIIWYRVRATKLTGSEILIGFANGDQELIDNTISEKLKADFSALYAVDIDTELVKLAKNSEIYKVGEVGDVFKYDELIKNFAQSQTGEAREFFERISSLPYIKERFANQDKLTFSYRSPYIENHWITVTGIVTGRHEDGSPALLCIGFSRMDEIGARGMESQARLQEQQKELEKALRNAEIANQAKSNFLFSMSHDIRTPMNAIKGYTAMAKKYVNDPERALDYLEKIDVSGQQLLALINQVLEMSRIESGKVELDEKPVNISSSFESLVTILSTQASSKGVEFNYSLSNVRHYNVLADDARMAQIALNVAGNAIKYTPEGGRVEYTIKEIPCDRDGYARFVLTVADTGIGMSEEFLEKIFEPFAREKTSTASHIQGTGLGMSIVKRLIDLLGGTIEIQSEPGKGSRFDITLDFRIDSCGFTHGKAKELVPVSARFEGRRALLVEDNEMNREIAKDILEEQGMIVEEACDGDIAVEMVRNAIASGDPNYYDCILMDIQMPRMNGYDATRAIRSIRTAFSTRIPIIAMTANAFDEDRQNALAAGMDDHLAKPIDIQKLFETLAKYL